MSQRNQHLTHAMLWKPRQRPEQFQTTWCFGKGWQHALLLQAGLWDLQSATVPRDPVVPLDLQERCCLLKLRQFWQKRSLQQSHFRGRKHIGFLDSNKWSSPVSYVLRRLVSSWNVAVRCTHHCLTAPSKCRGHPTAISESSSSLSPYCSTTIPFFCPSRLPFSGFTVLSLTRRPAGNRTTTGSLSATQECRDTNWATRTTCSTRVPNSEWDIDGGFKADARSVTAMSRRIMGAGSEHPPLWRYPSRGLEGVLGGGGGWRSEGLKPPSTPLQAHFVPPSSPLQPPWSPLHLEGCLKVPWSPLEAPLKPPWNPLKPPSSPLKPPWRSRPWSPFKPPSSPLQAPFKPPSCPLQAPFKPPSAPFKPPSCPLQAPFKPPSSFLHLEASLKPPGKPRACRFRTDESLPLQSGTQTQSHPTR